MTIAVLMPTVDMCGRRHGRMHREPLADRRRAG